MLHRSFYTFSLPLMECAPNGTRDKAKWPFYGGNFRSSYYITIIVIIRMGDILPLSNIGRWMIQLYRPKFGQRKFSLYCTQYEVLCTLPRNGRYTAVMFFTRIRNWTTLLGNLFYQCAICVLARCRTRSYLWKDKTRRSWAVARCSKSLSECRVKVITFRKGPVAAWKIV